jgi:hypothetical protein
VPHLRDRPPPDRSPPPPPPPPPAGDRRFVDVHRGLIIDKSRIKASLGGRYPLNVDKSTITTP